MVACLAYRDDLKLCFRLIGADRDQNELLALDGLKEKSIIRFHDYYLNLCLISTKLSKWL